MAARESPSASHGIDSNHFMNGQWLMDMKKIDPLIELIIARATPQIIADGPQIKSRPETQPAQYAARKWQMK
ncbi:hypothetical protein C3374_22590 [Pantoea sp. PSNIH4]|nr:hypothetical protein C3380_19595 [Pantoea sp. PSNIH5]POU59231.1 hypothetical protein C3374_22590 [Pantoea sp. PSNIH4]POY65742.1 hypothetical protein C3402_21915 [Pantoea sp. PSNIH3]